MSKKKEPEGGQVVDHTKEKISEACGITDERGRQLNRHHNPVHWVKHPEVIEGDWTMTVKAEEIVKLPENEAIFVVALLLGTIMNTHPDCIEAHSGVKFVQIPIPPNHPVAEVLDRIERDVGSQVPILKGQVREAVCARIFEMGLECALKDGKPICASLAVSPDEEKIRQMLKDVQGEELLELVKRIIETRNRELDDLR
jgi:hypothetical protein